LIEQKNIYDLFIQTVPLIKSSDEMMKKYEAFYGGVRKENSVKHQPGFLEGKNTEIVDMSKKGVVFNNATTYPLDLGELRAKKLEFSNPSVLIIHTHTSEGYSESPGARSTDNEKNVVAIGSIIKERLASQGIKVIHDTTQNDYPAYNGSYNKALGVIERNCAENPDIQVVLDVHRDYTARNENGTETQLIPATEVSGRKTAQVMLVVGTDFSGLTHPDWKHNLAFAVKINEELDKISESVMRPINVRKERFNQHMTKGSLIIEVGAASNTLSEAKAAAELIGDAIALVLKK
jgi:stage II sporulation protein P